MNKVTRRNALRAMTAGIAGLPIAGLAASGPRPRGSRAQIRAYEIGDQKGLDSLRLARRPELVPGPGEAVVKVRAAALNRRDLDILYGRYYSGRKPPERIPLSDGAGEVIAVGEGVSNVQVGDRVSAAPFTTWMDGEFHPSMLTADLGSGQDGWLTERALLPAAALVKLPDSLGYEDAAALSVVGVTAWSILHTFGAVKPGDLVLTLGTGGLSMMAVQLAKMAGARAAITSSSDAKLAVARAHGADITINYRTFPDWSRKLLEETGGRGADIVVETVGASMLGQSLAACAPNARVGFVGSLAGPAQAAPNLGPLISKNVAIKGLAGGSRRNLERLYRAVEASGARPLIDQSFRFEEARAAYARLESGEHVGKIAIRFD